MKTALNSTALRLATDGTAPEWVHVLPSGSFSGVDGRGPYTIDDAQELIRQSVEPGRKLPIDVNHAIDLQGKDGKPSPARGWIVALEARADGIWGRVEWTDEGAREVGGRDYGYLSPVFLHTKGRPHRVTQLLRVSLTNDPNLKLTALHSRKETDMEEELRSALGLPENADQAAILAAVTASLSASTAAVATMARVAKAAGLAESATADQVVTALQSRGSAADTEVAELRDQVKQLNTQLTTVVTEAAKKAAVSVVDKAIEEGKVVPALRDRFIARHMREPEEVEAEIKLMPSLHAGGLGKRRVLPVEGDASLSDGDAEVCQLMGLDPKAFAKTSAAMKEVL